MVTILGIDPGSRVTGYGVIQLDGNRHQYITSGCIRIAAKALPIRLAQIFQELSELILEVKPDECAIEEVFMHRNASSALKLGQARGAAIVACANYDLPVAEYAARQVKQSVVGYGAADKAQVGQMVKTLLNLTGLPQSDAADALAIALCHAQGRRWKNTIAAQIKEKEPV